MSLLPNLYLSRPGFLVAGQGLLVVENFEVAIVLFQVFFQCLDGGRQPLLILHLLRLLDLQIVSLCKSTSREGLHFQVPLKLLELLHILLDLFSSLLQLVLAIALDIILSYPFSYLCSKPLEFVDRPFQFFAQLLLLGRVGGSGCLLPHLAKLFHAIFHLLEHHLDVLLELSRRCCCHIELTAEQVLLQCLFTSLKDKEFAPRAHPRQHNL
mmetsp:Transcript_103295/g.179203  ORF Transcript_103295/g.179203 Transcript_103295/m.179203 type:complete len:211 (-) Transcript_103295:16-648(-)